ncbi:FAD/NAD(P)-binding domain-containing protein, partial [Punctularia strigosozonata HHB-11173 SS5]
MGPLKLAVVGGGPSAFYVASRLLSLVPPAHPSASQLRVHLYDRLWAPHGLVRYGVAPDHPENCVHKFDEAAKDGRLKFFGNVNIGGVPTNASPAALSLPLSTLFKNYTHLLLASGCTVPILHPALPPSDRCVPALSVVHWYTAHPSRPPPPPLDKTSHVSVIGHGNVSLDVARMLLTDPAILQKYDVPEHVLEVLRRSSVKHVSIVGRRGPFQAAFTTKELREMMNLSDASMVPLDPSVLEPLPGETPTRQQTRTLQLLQKGSKNVFGTTPKTWSLDFFRSPTGLASSPESGSLSLSLAHTALDPATRRAVPTGVSSALATDLVVTSLGHRADPAGPLVDPELGHARAAAGRVVGLRNVYASGWAAAGARGVLASTMLDAHAVADAILGDWSGARATTPKEVMASGETVELEGVPEEVEGGVREGTVTTYEEWKRVDEEEVRR